MKTPLKLLLAEIEDNKENGCLFQLRAIKNAIEELLVEERKQIEDAFLHGKRDGLLNVHQKPESFFNSRYNQ
jgi:hypothetical protein